MKEKLINLFDYNDYEKFNKLKWLPSKNFMCNPIFKSTLVYNVVKGPITQNKIFWEHNLDTNNLSIDNINHVIVRFDQLTRQTLHDNNKTGYLLKKEKQIILYNNQNILSLIDDKNELYLFDNVMNHEILLLIPFLYTLKYDMYNLFSFQSTGPIEYHVVNLYVLINSANN